MDNENCEAGPSQPKAKRAKKTHSFPLSDAELLKLLEESDDELELLADETDSDSSDENEILSKTPEQAHIPDLPTASPSPTPHSPAASPISDLPSAPPSPQQLLNLPADPSSSVRTWLTDSPNVARIPFTGAPGLKVLLDGHSPIDYFNLLADDGFYDLILESSNNYAVEILAQSTGDQSRINSWRDITFFP
ncbi:unnamed protein product [Acanthoscelides obtectus]|uniref:Uncharacterized protein n=1 Tax=Acanthoscelides obtectus TaxID=200917 RepID=A0A9P0PG40_ACAOB|nr:unnamed protein product [Acanthoscelides obtectus]CAK1628540.1 hypothetical protein AOBTE_LOCUS5264 [Acanthoscelides obtectus]